MTRITGYWKMAWHQIVSMQKGEFHVERVHTDGVLLMGVLYIPLRLIERRCVTCGYKP